MYLKIFLEYIVERNSLKLVFELISVLIIKKKYKNETRSQTIFNNNLLYIVE